MEFRVFNLALVDFKKSWQFQKKIFKEVKNNYLQAALILCRHNPVITLGRLGKKENIKVSMHELKNRGIDIYEIDRGGDVTYHGPGQLIAYPIFNLYHLKKDIHFFLRQLEETIIDFLSDFGIKGVRYKGLTGVWIGKQKISSIGIAVKNWISFHGVSLNIKKDDLNNFYLIKPCGMDIQMTSMESILDRNVEIDDIKDRLIEKFKNNFHGLGKYKTPS